MIELPVLNRVSSPVLIQEALPLQPQRSGSEVLREIENAVRNGLVQDLPLDVMHQFELHCATSTTFTAFAKLRTGIFNISEFLRDYFKETWKYQPPQSESIAFENLDPDVEDFLMRNVFSMQLTYGCSLGCSFCGLNAPAGVRDAFTFDDIHRVITRYAEIFRANDTFFYYASDPFDWKEQVSWHHESLGYADIHRLVQLHAGYNPYVSTAIPKRQEDYVREHFDIVSRVSISFQNESRIDEALRSLARTTSKEMLVSINPNLSAKTRDKLRSLNGEELTSDHTIGCFDGVLLTPRGFFNVVQLPRSCDAFIEGQIVERIDPNSLTEKIPTSAIPIRQLLQMVTVSGQWRNGMGGSLTTTQLRSFFGPHNVNFIRVENSTGSGIFEINADTGMARPCPEDLYLATRGGRSRDQALLLNERVAYYLYHSKLDRVREVVQYLRTALQASIDPSDSFYELRKAIQESMRNDILPHEGQDGVRNLVEGDFHKEVALDIYFKLVDDKDLIHDMDTFLTLLEVYIDNLREVEFVQRPEASTADLASLWAKIIADGLEIQASDGRVSPSPGSSLDILNRKIRERWNDRCENLLLEIWISHYEDSFTS